MLIVELILSLSLIAALAAYRLAQLSAQKLILVGIGALFGSLIGSLLATPISALSDPYGQYLPTVVTILLAIFMAVLFYSKHEFLDALLPKKGDKKTKDDKLKPLKLDKNQRRILVDTSAIIDGRIGDIVATGFIPGALIVPQQNQRCTTTEDTDWGIFCRSTLGRRSQSSGAKGSCYANKCFRSFYVVDGLEQRRRQSQ